MFHLFNNVYLEHVQFYTSHFEHIILSSEESEHPVAKMAQVNLGTIPSFKDYLTQQHGGEPERFWETLLAKSPDEFYIIYLDQKLLNQLQIQYWKSIFEHASVEDLYKLYTFFYNDKRIKRLLSIEPQASVFGETESLEHLTIESFKDLFDSTSVSDELATMEKSALSFEYLLANYYLAPGTALASAFEEKLEILSWKAFFDNMSILRSEILNSFYDIKRIFPDAEIDFTSVTSIEHFIKSEPRLKWLSDQKFHARNINHVIRNYDKETFLHIIYKMVNAVLKLPPIPESDKKAFIDSDDQIRIINAVFDQSFKELLAFNIQKQFGCFFLGDDLNNRSNQLLPLFIYDKIRSNELGELNFLKIHQG